MKKFTTRILIGVGISVTSIALGVFAGVKITSSIYDSGLVSDSSSDHLRQLENILKENWYSEIYYGKDVDENVLINQFIGALSTDEDVRLDPYTYIRKYIPSTITPDENGKLGVTISKYFDYPVITEIDVNGAAYNNLQVGDIVLSISKTVDGKIEKYEISDPKYNFSTLFEASAAKPGATLTFEVARFDENKKMYIDTVDVILKKKTDTAYSYVIDENIDDTLMVKLTSFVAGDENGTCIQLDNILKENKDNNIIIDLRNNGGGDLYSVTDICDLFLPKNKLVTTLTYKNGEKITHYTEDNKMYEFDNIVILQNNNTASASEILISTLLYYYNDKVTLIGNKSYGKGIAQKTVPVFDGKYRLQYTCAKWLRPDDSWVGMTIDSSSNVGFMPDSNNIIYKDNLLSKMEYYNNGIYLKDSNDYKGFTLDSVSSINEYFFTLYNLMFDSNIRTDRYFDYTCVNAINEYQKLKGIEIDSNGMNYETFIYFVKDFYDLSQKFNDEHLLKAKTIIEA